MQTNIIEEQINFQSGPLNLSGILSYPDSREPEKAVLLCSPHPHFAGDMENNVIRHLANYFAKDSLALRFDYRGVGKSTINLEGESSVFDYWQQVEDSMDYTDAVEDYKKKVHDYCSEKHQNEEPIFLDEMSRYLDEENPTRFMEYAQERYEIPNEFQVDKSKLRRFLKYSGLRLLQKTRPSFIHKWL